MNMYSKVFELHSELLKALAHPKRLEILHLLRDQELTVTEIQQMLDLPQANLSQQLAVLRQAQVVKSRRDGKEIFYSLKDLKFVQASDLVREILIEQHKGTELEDELSYKMSEWLPIVHDPICNMRLSPKTAAFAKKFKGKEYFFCASGCLGEFERSIKEQVSSIKGENEKR